MIIEPTCYNFDILDGGPNFANVFAVAAIRPSAPLQTLGKDSVIKYHIINKALLIYILESESNCEM